jgi:hypothetical protein
MFDGKWLPTVYIGKIRREKEIVRGMNVRGIRKGRAQSEDR